MSKEKTKTEEIAAPAVENTSQEGKVGTMLHDVRVKKKISIEEIAKDLYIKPAYLTAIEQSDYANIPEHPYGVGFVRSYANYLGLNSSRIVQIFKEETEGSKVSNEEYKVFTPKDENEVTLSGQKYLLISLAMIIFGYVLWAAFDKETVEEPTMAETETTVSENNDTTYPLQIENFTSESEITAEDSNEEQQITITNANYTETSTEDTKTVTPTDVENKSQEATKTTPVAEEEAPAKKTGRVVLKIKKETWIEVKDENKLWISKVLQAGSEYIVPENGDGKTVSFGNTDGVDVIIDGKIVTIVSPNKKTNIKLDAFLNNNH